MSLSLISYGSVSTLTPSSPVPRVNADTITASLAPFLNKSGRDGVYKAALTGFLGQEGLGSCGGNIGGPSIETGLISAGLGSIPVVGATLSKIFGVFGAHHAAAVKTEQATLCKAVPDANAFLRGIDSALAQGQIDVATAAQALEEGYQNWLQGASGILQGNILPSDGRGGKCNAACDYGKAFRAAIENRKANYAI